VDVYLNDELVLKDVCFRADKYQDYSATLSFGTVQLEEGTNSLVIRTSDNVHHIAAGGYAARANCYINKISFLVPEPVELLENGTATINLPEGYLHHKTVITAAHSVSSSDKDVAAATLNSDGTMQIKAGKCGEATLTVYEGNTVLCDVDVIVSEPSAPEADDTDELEEVA
jgi:hypothetical protein